VKIVLTDNGKEFTDRFRAGGEGKPTGEHEFDRVCRRYGVEHRLIKPYRAETNGMVERFNGRIKDILVKTRFKDSKELAETLRQYLRIYNHWIPQRALGGKSPVEALKEWQERKPELFKKSVYKLAGPDN